MVPDFHDRRSKAYVWNPGLSLGDCSVFLGLEINASGRLEEPGEARATEDAEPSGRRLGSLSAKKHS
jgi:hypothetical protein